METDDAMRVAGLNVESGDTPAKPEDYLFVNGHRLVKPYHFDYGCNMKQRWIGKNIIDIFSKEFPARDRQYYLQALVDGRLRVEGAQVTAETPLRDGQRMRHFIHRHEAPVLAGSVEVVGQDGDMVAVNKPHGMPVHVAGQYRKNTVLGILTAEHPELAPLYPIHRLDKPVSGLLLFARTPRAAATLCKSIESREVEKVYVARVLGRFPASDEPIVANVPLAWDPVGNHATAVPESAEAVAAAAEAAAAGSAQDGQQQQQQEQQQQEGQQQQQQQEQGVPAGLSLQEERQFRKQQQAAWKTQRKAAKLARQAAAAEAAANRTAEGGAAKPALTEFRLLAVAPDGLTSIVECRPRTGRTHQIRVHLQHLGHPIANDFQYGGTYSGPLASRQMAEQLGVHWVGNIARENGGAGGGRAEGTSGGGNDGAGAATVAAAAAPGGAVAGKEAAAERSKRQRVEGAAAAATAAESEAAAARAAGAAAAGDAAAAAAAAGAQDASTAAVFVQNAAFRSQPEYEVPAELCDPLCSHCPYFAPMDYPVDLRPLWLHARSYSCQDAAWSFSTKLPEWAHADWQPPA